MSYFDVDGCVRKEKKKETKCLRYTSFLLYIMYYKYERRRRSVTNFTNNSIYIQCSCIFLWRDTPTFPFNGMYSVPFFIFFFPSLFFSFILYIFAPKVNGRLRQEPLENSTMAINRRADSFGGRLVTVTLL